MSSNLFSSKSALPLGFSLITLGCAEPSLPEPRTTAGVQTSDLALAIHLRSNGIVTQAFVSPERLHAVLSLDQRDKLFLAAEGIPEIQLVPHADAYLGQITTDSTRFTLTLARSGARTECQIELPPPFALSGEQREDRDDGYLGVIAVSWTPSAEGSQIQFDFRGPQGWHTYDFMSDVGSFSMPVRDLERTVYIPPERQIERYIVVATRKGGKATCPASLGSFAPPPRLEQIRTIAVP